MRALRVLLLALLLPGTGAVQAGPDDADEPAWRDVEVAPPAFPRDSDLVEFYVSATTTNRFFIDARSLDVGGDGVVRYVLVVISSGGATNVTFEGMRCKEHEYRLYATGRNDRSWGSPRRGEWRSIENKVVNRHHAELWRNHFCPGGAAIVTPDEGRDALRRGKHPRAD